MSSNKSAKEELIRLYGAECFIEKLKLRKFDKPTHYTSKGQLKRMKQLTYHHIRMKKDGGKATVENGALLSAENHSWFHQQSPSAQEYMNAVFQEYKKQMDECRVVLVDDLDFPFEVKCTTEFSIDEKGHYNRAEKKREDEKIIKEYFENEQDLE